MPLRLRAGVAWSRVPVCSLRVWGACPSSGRTARAPNARDAPQTPEGDEDAGARCRVRATGLPRRCLPDVGAHAVRSGRTARAPNARIAPQTQLATDAGGRGIRPIRVAQRVAGAASAPRRRRWCSVPVVSPGLGRMPCVRGARHAPRTHTVRPNPKRNRMPRPAAGVVPPVPRRCVCHVWGACRAFGAHGARPEARGAPQTRKGTDAAARCRGRPTGPAPVWLRRLGRSGAFGADPARPNARIAPQTRMGTDAAARGIRHSHWMGIARTQEKRGGANLGPPESSRKGALMTATQPDPRGEEAFSSSVVLEQNAAAPETLLACARPADAGRDHAGDHRLPRRRRRPRGGRRVGRISLHDFPPYRSSVLRHPTKNPKLVDPETIELWSPASASGMSPPSSPT